MTASKIKIRGYHLDGYLHVNNARYLEFMEEARWEYLDSIDAKNFFHEKNLAFVIVNINISYRAPLVQGQELHIHTKPSKKGNTSWIFDQVGYIAGTEQKAFEAVVTFVIIDAKSGKPIRVSDEMEAKLLPQEV